MNAFNPTPRVLVVDDHQAHAEGLAEQLALRGFETASASTDEEALELVANWQPDAVLTDLNQSGIDFLLTDLDVASTFLNLAEGKYSHEISRRNYGNATQNLSATQAPRQLPGACG